MAALPLQNLFRIHLAQQQSPTTRANPDRTARRMIVAPPTDDLDQLPLFVPATEINLETLIHPSHVMSYPLGCHAIWPQKLFSREPPANPPDVSTCSRHEWPHPPTEFRLRGGLSSSVPHPRQPCWPRSLPSRLRPSPSGRRFRSPLPGEGGRPTRERGRPSSALTDFRTSLIDTF